jgi:hypothetical protein
LGEVTVRVRVVRARLALIRMIYKDDLLVRVIKERVHGHGQDPGQKQGWVAGLQARSGLASGLGLGLGP